MIKTNNKYSIHAIKRHRILRDGKGITTLIGLCGCPLKCRYCINPLHSKIVSYEKLTCSELLNIVDIDNLYFLATGGGVTFGGGEPLLYPELIVEFANSCNRRWKINIESSFNVPREYVENIISKVDEIIVDVKDMNPLIYQNYTGCSNRKVIENLKYVASTQYQSKMHIRVPLIPNYNSLEDVGLSIKQLEDMGFTKIEQFTYISNVEEINNIKDDGMYGKYVCETLKEVRKAIVDSINIECKLLSCVHTRCESGTCPACEQELKHIEDLIVKKYSMC